MTDTTATNTPGSTYEPSSNTVANSVVEAGCSAFEQNSPHFPNGVPRYNVLNWLFQYCMSAGVKLEGYEVHNIVDRIQAFANNVKSGAPHQVLTVRELRDVLAGLPENMPVMYQRIEDVYFEKHNWKATPLTWESYEATPEDLAHLAENPCDSVRLVAKDGKSLIRQMSPYVPAFGSYVTTDDEGRRYLCIHAHY